MDQKGSKLSKLSNLRICRGECPFQCFHKNNRNESRIKRWLIHSIMLCASKNIRLILQVKNYRLIGKSYCSSPDTCVQSQFEPCPHPKVVRTWGRTIVRRRMFATNRFVTSACSGQSVTSRLRSITS